MDAKTFFDEMKRSFADVSINENNEIDTAEFLEAAESLVKLFDLLGSSAFAVVQNDMNGNIKKIREYFLANPEKAKTLQGLILSEAGTKSKTATQGLLWLCRGLQFTAQALQDTIDNPSKEMSETFTSGYNKTLVKYHSFIVKPIFKMAMKACPYRKDFFAKLGSDQAKVDAQLKTWLAALQKINDINFAFFASGKYDKGL